MRILVTGGAGYIGSHTCKALSLAGHEPIVFDNLSRGHRDAVRWGPLIIGNLLDSAALDAAFRTYRPDGVIHFAALAYVGESVGDPGPYYRVNVTGTQTLLEAMRRHGRSTIVFSSTCATYGVPGMLPITEATQQAPINPYGFTKLVIERMLQDYTQAYGFRSIALRYFNAAGADPDGDLGERHDPETHAIPLAIMAALGEGGSFHIFGTDYPTPDGTAVRDYVHVSDLADAHVKAMEQLAAGGVGGAYNLATGVGTSVLDIVRAVEAATGRELPTVRSQRRPGDPPSLFATGELAREQLGWKPAFQTIGPTVDTAVQWFMENRYSYGDVVPLKFGT